jgi:hypothetical protein
MEEYQMEFLRKIVNAVKNIMGTKNLLAVAVLVSHIVNELAEDQEMTGEAKFEKAVAKLKVALSGAGVKIESNADSLARFFVQGAVLVMKSNEKSAAPTPVAPPAPPTPAAPTADTKKANKK